MHDVDLFALARGSRNPTAVLGDQAFIALRTGEVAVVDAADLPLVAGRPWSRVRNQRTTYCRTHIDGRTVAMHRIIAGIESKTRSDRVCVDHINHDGLDNRRANLRVGDYVTNGANRRPNRRGHSRFKGVLLNRKCMSNPWRARIQLNGQDVDLGGFATEEGAARAYDAAAREMFGEFAYLNFPDRDTKVPPSTLADCGGTQRGHTSIGRAAPRSATR